MCISCHKVCNQTFPCLFYEFVCAVWGIFFVWTFFHMFHSWISSLLFFLTLTMSPPQFNWCFCKLSFRVYTFSHFSHSNTFHTQTKWVFMCLGGSPFATTVALSNCVDICFFKIYAVWNFLSQMLQLDSFFWWYSLKCLLKQSLLLNSFPQTAHWSWMFMAQSQGHNWRVQQYSKQWVLLIFKDSKPPSYPNSVLYFLPF